MSEFSFLLLSGSPIKRIKKAQTDILLLRSMSAFHSFALHTLPCSEGLVIFQYFQFLLRAGNNMLPLSCAHAFRTRQHKPGIFS